MSRRPSALSVRRRSSVVPAAQLTRRASAISNAETGYDEAAVTADQAIHEEIDEIKRYEDFTTIDWVQDAAREQLRRKARRQEAAGFFERNGRLGWRRKLWESYDAGQAWIVVTLIGAAIGLNAAFLNIVTEWLSDIKLGYCTTAFYLNENFCCWGAESGCAEWHRWSSIWPVNYMLYIVFSAVFAFSAARLVKSFAPYAAGSGISEIKCIIAGFVMKGFLGPWTLLIKSISLPLAIASGLSVGKEGPSVHYAVCTGNVISQFFAKYKRNASKTREILSACAAAGVGVAFGSPIGGVLFSLEEMSNYFPLKTMWRSYFCALVATAVLAAMNPFRTGQLVMFQVKYDRDWHFFETIFYIIIGIFGGLYGAFVIKWNLRAQAFRKKYLAKYPIMEATLLALLTAIICYPNMFLRIDMTESMEILFLECEGDHDYDELCERQNRWRMIISLALATVVRTGLVIISYGCKVPAGIFVPSMAIGASFGRMVGIFVEALHEAFPSSQFFAACKPDVPCITPGTYAFLGAGAALSGIMHITVSVVVIMFELTGALTYILPTMIVVGVTKAVGERFGKGGIADRAIWFNGFPFLDNKEEHIFGVPVSQVMTTNVTSLPSSGLELRYVEKIMTENIYQGYPIVESHQSKTLVGYIGRTELRYAIDRAKRDQMVPQNAKCYFTPPTVRPATTPSATVPAVTFDTIAATSAQMAVDFSRFIDPTPLSVHPRLPLETVMEVFKKMGPRVILIEYRGKLTGLVTVKDCLKYQFKVEAHENPRDEGTVQEAQEKLWGWMSRAGGWIAGKVSGSRFVRFCYRSAAYCGSVVLVTGAVITAFFIYDATTYKHDPSNEEITVSELALHPKRGGPKNLPIASVLVDDDDLEGRDMQTQKYKPKLVILGTGWGSVALLKGLNPDDYHITVVSPSNYFLFTPMLPSATVGTLELRSLVEPIRRIITRVKGHFLKAQAEDVDFSEKLVEVSALGPNGEEQHFYLPYDKLVIGVGSVTNPHGVKGLENCHFLKDVRDARKIRNTVMRNLETACLPTTSDEERKRLLSFVISGGGPTGVEFAAELFDMLNEDLCNYFPKILRSEISVHVIQSRGHILNTYDEALSRYAEARFAHDHVDVLTNSRVKEVQPDKILFTQKDEETGKIVTKELPMGFCLWSTGVSQPEFCKKLAKKLDGQKNRHALETDSHLRLIGAPLGDVYAIGDCSTVQNNVSDHIVTFLRTLAWERGKDPQQMEISYKDWRSVAKRVKQRFPQASDHLRRLDRLFEQYDKDKSGKLDFGELHELLHQIDSKLTSLPATAQRAHQQGQYLARKLNKIAQAAPGMRLNEIDYGDLDEAVYKAFEYKHLGSLAYIGNAAVFDINGLNFSGGLLAVYLWRSVYFAQSVSFRTRVLMAMDWTKRALFGRDMMNY